MAGVSKALAAMHQRRWHLGAMAKTARMAANGAMSIMAHRKQSAPKKYRKAHHQYHNGGYHASSWRHRINAVANVIGS